MPVFWITCLGPGPSWQSEMTFLILPKMTGFPVVTLPIPSTMRTSARNSSVDQPTVSRWFAAAPLMLLALIAGLLAMASVRADTLAEAAGLPKLIRTKHRSFAIPFKLPESKDPDADAAPQRVILNISKDLGATWSVAGETAPTAGSFAYTAEADGEYWFRLRAVDKKGRSRGSEGPDIRVLVDAAGPRLAARVWKGADGEIVCRYAAADDSLKLESLVLEYQGGQEKGWKSVAADAVLARETPAHMVGEAIWWAGERVDQLVVKISLTDTSGNQTVKQFSLDAKDPGVDQSALARELGLPPLPTASAEPEISATVSEATTSPAVAPETRSVMTSSDQTSPGQTETASWSDDRTVGNDASARRRPSGPTAIPAAAGLLPRAKHDASRAVAPTASAAMLAAAASATPGAENGGPLEYQGRPLHLVNTRRFAWDYEIPAVRRTAGPLRAELWTTIDGGVTWQRAAVDKQCRSPIAVELPSTGFYGVRLELVADVPDAEGGPRSGSEPDAWVGVDDEAPQVELIGIDRDEPGTDDSLVIRYAARDPLLTGSAVRLMYSPNASGPWATVASGLANEGSHRWEPGKSVPARAFLRVEATDAAGNLGSAVSDEPVSVAPTRVPGRLGSLHALPRP